MGEIFALQCGDRAPEAGRIDILEGFVAIVRRVILEKHEKLRNLQRLGVIRERTRRAFDENLSSGKLSLSELANLFEHLGIDMTRAMVAVGLLRDPMLYFEDYSDVLATYTQESSLALHEQISAAGGNFGPIRRSLLQAHASKLTKHIFESQQRAIAIGEEAFLNAIHVGENSNR